MSRKVTASALAAFALVFVGGTVLAGTDLANLDVSELMARRPPSADLAQANRFYNVEAVIPPQCYTRIEDRHNPCYVCHQSYADATRPNYMDDGSLQEAYNFSDAALTNHWANLFVDRSADVAAISDAAILDYVSEDNYSSLADQLTAAGWTGWTPDLAGYGDGASAFDEIGFAKDDSGWVAFNYKPQPSTFWPTNGSTDDVLIRLPLQFRADPSGALSRDVYLANLALLEIAFQDLERTSVPSVDERAIGVDLDGDGLLGPTATVERRDMFVGSAANTPLRRMLYPLGTEFLHSVRYVGVDGDSIVIPRRMKELRYMRKTFDYRLADLRSLYGNEHQEKVDENLPRFIDVGDAGMDNGFGWVILAFIEAADGTLRPQTNEELFFCKGCHTTIGANVDQTWAFPRKVTGADGWGYVDYTSLTDAPNLGQSDGEILTYFQRVGGGDEFRSNREMLARWFTEEGTVDIERVRAASVYELITPSRERALDLNKAYRVIVAEQSFLFGRDATITPPAGVHADIDSATAPTLPPDRQFEHDIRLDWSAGQ